MKKTIVSIFLSFVIIQSFGQTRPQDAYYFEELGYFMNAQPVENGIVFTDNYCNNLYFYMNGEAQTIANSAGCGRYFMFRQMVKMLRINI